MNTESIFEEIRHYPPNECITDIKHEDGACRMTVTTTEGRNYDVTISQDGAYFVIRTVPLFVRITSHRKQLLTYINDLNDDDGTKVLIKDGLVFVSRIHETELESSEDLLLVILEGFRAMRRQIVPDAENIMRGKVPDVYRTVPKDSDEKTYIPSWEEGGAEYGRY